MVNYEELGKAAVKAGYDGGGIWACSGPITAVEGKSWKRAGKINDVLIWLWPDFSYPETEGAGLAWIAEKKKVKEVTLVRDDYRYFIRFYREEKNKYIEDVSTFLPSDASDSRAEALLSAIQSLNLGKKDNSPMGLNKRLLEVGFKESGCMWRRYVGFEWYGRVGFPKDEEMDEVVKYHYPDGSHPSTIGVATAWLRGFEKIGNALYFYYYDGFWKIGSASIFCTYPFGQKGFGSELEALVEFAEWAKEEGLMK